MNKDYYMNKDDNQKWVSATLAECVTLNIISTTVRITDIANSTILLLAAQYVLH